MFSRREMLLVMLVSVTSIIMMFTVYGYVQRHSPIAIFLGKVDAFDQRLHRDAAPSPLINALSQTTVCIQDGLPLRGKEDRERQRLSVLDPCVQQGLVRLQQGGHGDLSVAFQTRLQPLLVAFDQG